MTFRAEDAIDRVLEENPILAGKQELKACSTLASRFIGYEGKPFFPFVRQSVF
jgi:hypothetical protein